MGRLTKAALWGPRKVEGLMDKHAEATLDREKRLVEVGHEAERGIWLRAIGRLVLGITALIAYQSVQENGALQMTLGVVCGWMIGSGVLANGGKAMAYRRGWLDGRLRFVRMAEQHQKQRNSPFDWVRTELDHDSVHVMGLPPVEVRWGPDDPGDDRRAW